MAEDIITDIGQDHRDFLLFSYELLKEDKDQKYARDLLNGQIKPNVFTEIILSN
jgi:hypothetical protein